MNRSTIQLEVCANSVASAVVAQAGGAIRVELCENLREGGTTPSYGQVLMARKLLHIELYILIRPRSGDFLYSDLEFDIMKQDVQHCIDAQCDGIVIGMLYADGSVDKHRCKELAQTAKSAGLGVTFHRAFDMCAEPAQALEDIIEIGCERLLTSGGKHTAIEGADTIAKLIKKAAGRISIMPGSGINATNVAELVRITGATELHASAKITVSSAMQFQKDTVLGDNEYPIEVTDIEKVKAILKMANS